MIRLVLILLGLCMALPGYAESKLSILSTENEFIKITVNNESYDTGRFAIETVKGDPKKEQDDHQPLIFGRPKPWTSYTTVLIDNTEYIFGGPTKKRAGKSGKIGEIISQSVNSGAIETTVDFGPIRAIQTLSFIRNPTTRVNDTVKIQYTLINDDSVPREVGLRIMLDTMLGSNDGAPLRFGDQAIESEAMFSGDAIKPFWQAFDRLADPTVLAQGTLALSSAGVYPPSRIALVNWGTLADHPYEFPYFADRSFIRIGETEKDTSLALYWDKIMLKPAEVKSFSTLYGLGNISVSPGELSLGLTAPAERFKSDRTPIMVVGYVQNSGGFDSQNTIATFKLPPGFELLDGQLTHDLSVLHAGKSVQLPIVLKPVNPKKGPQRIELRVKSGTLAANKITRTIEILSPPELKLEVISPPYLSLGKPYQTVTVNIQNDNATSLSDINIGLHPNPGIHSLWFEPVTKSIDILEAYESKTATWKLEGKSPGLSGLRVQVSSPVITPFSKSVPISLTLPKPILALKPSQAILKNGDHFYIWVWGKNLDDEDLNYTLSYDQRVLKLQRVTSPIPETDWDWTESQDLSIQVRPGDDIGPYLTQVHFKVTQSGQTTILLTPTVGNPVKLDLNITNKEDL